MNRRITGETFERTFTLERLKSSDGDKTKARYRASLSSTKPVKRWFGTEILEHTEDAIDFERAGRGLTLLFNHERNINIGKVTDIRLKGSRLVGDIQFAKNERAEQIKADVDDGMLSDISIGYQIDEYERIERDDGDEMRVKRWTPVEASLVTVPADPGVGIGRSNQEGKTMSNDVNTGQTGKGGGADNVANISQQSVEAIRQEERQKETARQKGIHELFTACGHRDSAYVVLRDELITSGASVDQAKGRFFELMTKEPQTDAEPTVEGSDNVRYQPTGRPITAGRNNKEGIYSDMEWALEFRAGVAEPSEGKSLQQQARENPYTGLTMGEMGREFLREAGIHNAGTLSMDQAARMIFDPRERIEIVQRRDLVGHATGDFPAILANVMGKRIVIGYNEAPETWREISFVSSVNDFKQNSRPSVSAFPDLLEIPEGSEYKGGTVSDLVEYLTAATWGRKLGIYRQTMINDDLSALTRLPAMMGRAAARTVGDQVYSVLTTNAALNQDSTTLFHADHGNIGTAGAPSTTTLSEGRRLMRVQTDPSGAATLNLSPAILLLPPIWETEGRLLTSAESLNYEAGGSTTVVAGSIGAANQFNVMRPVVESRLGGTAGTDNDWFLLAEPSVHPTVEIAFVNGQQEPYIESREGWDVDGIEWKVRLDFATTALDYRGVVRNAGS